MQGLKKEVRKIGTCLVKDYRTKRACGSKKWYPSTEEEYVCASCLSPIAWTRKLEREQNT